MNKPIWITALAAGALTLSGCGATDLMASPDERACLDAIRATLINPETASFHDFREFDEMDGQPVYQVRVRAEGRLGNTITKMFLCLKDDEYGMIATEA